MATTEMIVYSVLTVLALLEWLVFTSYYTANWMNVIRYPEKETNRGLSGVLMCIMFLLRLLFPAFYLLALPSTMTNSFLDSAMPILRIFSYIILGWWVFRLTFPSMAGVLSWIFHGQGNIHMDNTHVHYQEKFICILPVYQESLEEIVKSVRSFLSSHYPQHLLEIHVAFDFEEQNSLYCSFVKSLSSKIEPMNLPTSWRHTTSSGSVVFVHRWPQGGKRSAQAFTYHFIKDCTKTSDNSIVLFCNAGNVILNEALNNLSVYMNDDPDKGVMVGFVMCSSRPEKWYQRSLFKTYEDTDYTVSHSEMIFEMGLGSFTNISTGFTAMRYWALHELATEYFTPSENKPASGKKYACADRYLTHVAHTTFDEDSIGTCPVAQCKTDPSKTFVDFIEQRCQWRMGEIVNDAYMLSTPSIWRKYPNLLIFKLFQNAWRSTTMNQILVASVIIFKPPLAGYRVLMLSFLIPFALAWILTSISSIAARNYKLIIWWPITVLVGPLLQFMIDLCAIFYSKLVIDDNQEGLTHESIRQMAQESGDRMKRTLAVPVMKQKDTKLSLFSLLKNLSWNSNDKNHNISIPENDSNLVLSELGSCSSAPEDHSPSRASIESSESSEFSLSPHPYVMEPSSPDASIQILTSIPPVSSLNLNLNSENYLGDVVVEQTFSSPLGIHSSVDGSTVHFDFLPDFHMEFFKSINFDGFEVDTQGENPAIVSKPRTNP